MSRCRIAVFGAGAWGTALAQAFSASHDVVLWGRDRDQLDEIGRLHENSRYLRGVRLRDALAVEPDFARAAVDADLHLVVTPLAGLRTTVLEQQPEAQLARPAPDGREIALTLPSVATLTRLGTWQHLRAHECGHIRDV